MYSFNTPERRILRHLYKAQNSALEEGYHVMAGEILDLAKRFEAALKAERDRAVREPQF